MSKKEFAEFMSRQRSEDPIDWNSEKEEWLAYLKTLYKMIEAFLAEFIQSNQIIVSYKSVEIEEDGIGLYTARSMMLEFGKTRIKLIPIGTLLIGSKGRVDMTGPRSIIRLVLKDKDTTREKITVIAQNRQSAPRDEVIPNHISWEWKIVDPNDRRPTYLKLTQDTFLDALIQVAGG